MPALHNKLKNKLTDTLNIMRVHMTSHFAINIPYKEAQEMLIPDEDRRYMFQEVGKLLKSSVTSYDYSIGSKIKIYLYCRPNTEMSQILFPENAVIHSPEFINLVRPLYQITKAWNDLTLSFNAVCNIVSGPRELNFYVPWLRYVFPDEGFTNVSNGAFRVSKWLSDNSTHSTIITIHRQINEILSNVQTDKRTWMPVELVKMVRTGEELITQYNIMKRKPVDDSKDTSGTVTITILPIFNHPVVGWEVEARRHKAAIDLERLRKEKEKKRNEKNIW
jgi:hypothetical protein